jgi:RNA polymerase sigma-70 factor (ECF subfamily)
MRIAKPRRIDSRASEQLNSGQVVAPPCIGEEWAVVQQAIAGNPIAQEHLFARHTGRLYRTAFAVLSNKEDAEDALQDGLCTAYTKLRSFQGRSAFSTWLTRIVINSALMTRRRRRAHSEVSLDEVLESQPGQSPLGVADTRSNPEELYAAAEIHSLVEEHARQLPPALQTAFRHRAISGLSVTESSHALGIPASVFKARVFRARRKVARGLRQSPEIAATLPYSGVPAGEG